MECCQSLRLCLGELQSFVEHITNIKTAPKESYQPTALIKRRLVNLFRER